MFFSTTWQWGSFDSLEQKNLSNSSFIISNNFSPFSGKLLDVYLMVDLLYIDINTNTNINQNKKHLLENVSFYVLIKTYFENIIKVSFELEPYSNDIVDDKIKTILQQLVISK